MVPAGRHGRRSGLVDGQVATPATSVSTLSSLLVRSGSAVVALMSAVLVSVAG